MRTLFAVLAALLLFAIAPAARAATPISRFVLPNGLVVVVQEDHSAPAVALSLRYHVGSRNDPPARGGLALLTQYAMVEASKHLGPGEYARLLERAGAVHVSATMGHDTTKFQAMLPASRLEIVLWAWSEQMGFFAERVDQALVDSRREVVRNERRERWENPPRGLVPEILDSALYPPGHPYRHVVVGGPHDLDGVTAGEVRDFFRHWYAPNNAILTVTGDTDEARVRALVARYFGTIPRSPDVSVTAPSGAAPQAERRIAIDARIDRAWVEMAWLTPPEFADGNAALDVLARLLAGSLSATLYWRLVDDVKIASAVRAWQGSDEWASEFHIAAMVAPGHTPQEVAAAIDDHLRSLAASPANTTDVGRAAYETLFRPLLNLQHLTERASKLGLYEEMGKGVAFLGDDVGRYGVLPGDISTGVARWLPLDRRVVAFVRPSPGAPVGGVEAAPAGAAR